MATKYKTIYDDFRKKILDGDLAAGDRLPDELTLCKEYNCSRMTVKKGLDILVQEGLIYRKQGQGSFVLSQPEHPGRIEVQERDLSGFSRSAGSANIPSQLLSFQLVFASDKIAEYLNVNPGDPLYEIHRLRLVDGEPYVLEKTYMPTDLIKGVNLDVLEHSIYNYIENTLGLKIASAKKSVYADVSDETDHTYLKLKDTEPVFVVEQTAYLDNGKPFEYSISRHRFDRFRFNTYSVRH